MQDEWPPGGGTAPRGLSLECLCIYGGAVKDRKSTLLSPARVSGTVGADILLVARAVFYIGLSPTRLKLFPVLRGFYAGRVFFVDDGYNNVVWPRLY